MTSRGRGTNKGSIITPKSLPLLVRLHGQWVEQTVGEPRSSDTGEKQTKFLLLVGVLRAVRHLLISVTTTGLVIVQGVAGGKSAFPDKFLRIVWFSSVSLSPRKWELE